jgi:hypothetical protein
METTMVENRKHSYAYRMGLEAKGIGLLLCIQEVQS